MMGVNIAAGGSRLRLRNRRIGYIGFQIHGIKPGTGPFEVAWRELRVRELQ